MASNTEDEDQFMCPIHCDILDDPIVLDVCQHWFCKDCLRKYVASKNGIDPDCPECRTPIDLPPDGVDGLTVNYKMRQICSSLRTKKQKQNQQKYCPQHPDEILERFCCDCLVPVCEDCGDGDHNSHKHRPIGSAWKVVGKKIEDKFKTAKAALAVSESDYRQSQQREATLVNQADLATAEINSLLANLYEQLNLHNNTLQAGIQEQLGQDLQREEAYLRSNNEIRERAKMLETYEHHLRNLLSSGGRSVTDTDLDALNSLHRPYDPAKPKDPPPRHITRKFHPSPHVSKLLTEGFGAMLTDKEIEVLKTKERGETAGFVNHGIDVARGSHSSADVRRTSSTLSVSSNDDEQPTPTHLRIRTKARIILPPEIAQPCDVEPWQSEQQFLVSDMKGAITLVTGSPDNLGGLRCINIKPPTSDFVLGTSGISSIDKRFLFSCNQHEPYIEQYDIQSVHCVQRFNCSDTLTYPRCITHSLTNNVLFVSDTKGGVKAFGSNTGRQVADIGSNFLLTPTGIATDFKWRLFVADELQSRIYVFDIRNITGSAPLYEIKTSFKGVPVNCHGVSVGRNNNILVSVTKRSSSYDSINLLLELNEEGQMLRAGGWELCKPRGLRVHGKIATVVDADANCIVTYQI